MRELMILLPPHILGDEEMAKLAYDEFNFGQHTTEEQKSFELKHLSTLTKNIDRKKKELRTNVRRTTQRKDDEPDNYLKDPPWDTIHIKLPEDSGRISRLSVSMLYSAIVCLVFRDVMREAPLSIDICKAITHIIYTYFSLIEDDLRHQRTWLYWMPIFSDVENHGYHAAAALNATPTLYCKFCSNPRNEIFVKMKDMIQDDGSIEYTCTKCGSDSPLTARVSTKYLHNIYAKASDKAKDAVICLPEYKEIKEIHKCFVDSNKETFLKRFREYEALAIKDLLSAREHYFIGHYDPTKKSKRRWCPINEKYLAQVKINDNRYSSQYLPFANEYVYSYLKGLAYKSHRVLDESCNVLREIGWPDQYILDKFQADVKNILDSNFSCK
jgi:hypothetical protein